jgi:uncharacterized protein (DUF1501 family)
MLRLGLAGLASVGLGSAVAGCRDRAAPVRPGRPRYFVTILLSGGIDPIWTTDPRARGEVEAGIDVPYEPGAIVEAGALRFGPHLAALAPVADRLSVINGVQTGTANHNWGWLQFDRLRTRVDDRMPVIGSLLGERRDGQPLAVLQLPADDATLVRAERASAEDRRAMAAALERQHRRLGGERGGGPAGRSLAAAAALLDRMATASAFAAAPWTDATRPIAVNLQQDLQRALWAIENDLVACCQVSVDRYGQPWDSHWDNHRVQTSTSRSTMPLIARFLRELGERRNAHGALADQTLVVLGSELGRFPRLNGAHGKDHWPEAPFLFWGAGIVPQQRFGETGAHLEARPVSLRTGRAVAAGGELVTLDDIGATLLDLAGVDPAPRGYLGRRLDFLVAA